MQNQYVSCLLCNVELLVCRHAVCMVLPPQTAVFCNASSVVHTLLAVAIVAPSAALALGLQC